MNDLIVLQLLDLINSEFDQIEMTLENIKYLNDPIIQVAIRKIKLLCFKFAINNNLNSEKFRHEMSLILSGYDQEKRNYLETYANDLTNKMQNVINPPEIKEFR